MKQFYLSAGLVMAASLLLAVAGMCAQDRQQASASGEQPGQQTTVRMVVTFPPRITKLLSLSPEQEAQLQEVYGKFQGDVVAAEQGKRGAFTALQAAALSEPLNQDALKQRKDELVAANARSIHVNAAMLTEMRKVFTPDQLKRLGPELPIARNGLQLIVQLPEALSLLDLTQEQQSQLQNVVRGQEQKMVGLSRKEKAARAAMERAILGEQYDEAAANHSLEELVAVAAEQVEVNTGILAQVRAILTPDQLKRLNDMATDR